MNLIRLAITVLLVLAKGAHTGEPTQKNLLLAQEILDFHKKSEWCYIENAEKYKSYFDKANVLSLRPEDISSLQDSLKDLNIRLQKKREDAATTIYLTFKNLGIKIRSFATGESNQPLKEVFFPAHEKKTIRDKEPNLIMFVDEEMELMLPMRASETPENNIQNLLSYHEKTIQYLDHPIIKYIKEINPFDSKNTTKEKWNKLFEEFNEQRHKNGGYAYYVDIEKRKYVGELGPIFWNPEDVTNDNQSFEKKDNHAEFNEQEECPMTNS